MKGMVWVSSSTNTEGRPTELLLREFTENRNVKERGGKIRVKEESLKGRAKNYNQ